MNKKNAKKKIQYQLNLQQRKSLALALYADKNLIEASCTKLDCLLFSIYEVGKELHKLYCQAS